MKNSQSFWNFFLLVWDIEWKIFHLLSTSFRRVCQNCILSVQKITLRKTSFLNRKINIFCHFPTLGWKFSVFSRNSSRGWPKLHSTWTGAQFRLWKNFLQSSGNKIYLSSCDIKRKNSSLLSESLRRFCQNCIQCVQRTTWKKLFLEKIVVFVVFGLLSYKLFDLLANKFQRGCRNCFLRVR